MLLFYHRFEEAWEILFFIWCHASFVLQNVFRPRGENKAPQRRLNAINFSCILRTRGKISTKVRVGTCVCFHKHRSCLNKRLRHFQEATLRKRLCFGWLLSLPIHNQASKHDTLTIPKLNAVFKLLARCAHLIKVFSRQQGALEPLFLRDNYDRKIKSTVWLVWFLMIRCRETILLDVIRVVVYQFAMIGVIPQPKYTQ